ncbi:uncharacterized protein KIAA2012 homolog isoform X2 [Pleurodeles waltl]|uniref:uncharacterized protein KIAA2012 homolog isoform X2 n=1 Tax=Pleurodeles waltl TaxID=8319 RepID=UPI00370989D3
MTTLSLLSRGCGQVFSPNQRLEVHFEPEDYFNWKTREGLVHVSHETVLEQGSWRHSLHKTYTTRRGALVLYAEDLALPSWKIAGGRKSRHWRGPRKKKFEIELRTLRDLAGAILSYGRKQKGPVEARWQPYLHFLSEQDSRTDRQMHPGYSAKRYLSCLSQTWDPSMVYRLQCAGSIRDPAVMQTTAPSGAAPARREQDLSAAPAQYHLLPVMSSIHDLPWTEPRKRNSSGQCSPVLEEQENEELQERSEENGWRVRVPAPSIASRRTLGLEATPQHERLSTRNEPESYIDFLEATPMEFYHSEEHSAGENQEHVETQSKTRVPSFGNISFETSLLQTGKSHTTFYGGQFSGRKKSQNVKQGQTQHQDDKEDHATQEPLLDGRFLPPISSTQNTDHGGTRESNTKQVQETLKLPPISEELPRAQPPRKRRTRASEPPKELLVLPLLVHFQGEENEKAADEGEAALESSKSEFTASEILGSFPNDPVQVALPEDKVHNLQMDIDWNPENHPDALPVVPPLGRLPPLIRKKGPGNQSSNAKASSNNSSNSSSNNNSSRGLPTGTIRGTLPEELRDFCKGSSVGSLIMGPDGEIICLSLLGSAQDTDIPVQLDFVSDGAHLSLVSEASQEEEWPGIQQSQLPGVSDPDRLPSISVPTEARDRVSYSTHEEQNRPWIDSEDTVALSNDQIAGTLDKKRAARGGSVKDSKSPPPPKETFDDTQEESVKENKPLILPQKKADDTPAPSEPPDEGGVMGAEDPSVTAAGLGNAERPEGGNVQDSEQYIVGMDTEETDPTPQEEAPPVPDALPRPGSSTQQMLMEPQTEGASDAVKQHDGESARDMPQQKEGEPKSVNVLPARPKSTRTVKETLRPGPSDSLAVDSAKSTVQQEIGGSMAPESVPSAGVQTSLDVKQHMAEYKELAVLEAESQQPIAVINKEKEPTKSKGKSKPKNEKVAKQPAAPKETKKNSDKEKPKGKAVFVVGKPKQKKSEEKLEPSTKQESTNEMSMEPKVEVVMENDEEDNPSGSAIVRHTEPDITVSPASRGSTPFRPPSEEPQLSEIPLAEEQRFAPVENTTEIVPENQVKGRETSAHPSISISLLSGDTASEMSESNQGSSRQDKSSRDKLRAEQAEKRRLEVERKRREREEQKRAEQEKLEREERMKDELEREQQRRAEEMRLRKQQLEEDQQRKEQEALRKAQLEKQAQERARQQQEEYRRKMQEMQRRKQQEERERAELEEKMKVERERALAEERQRLQGMAESERQEYYRRKQEEEERARREEEERRQRAEEQRRLALEEAQRQAQLFARERAALERQLNFQRELMKESIGMDQSQDISRPWVFSYYQLLEMLGLQPTVEEK